MKYLVAGVVVLAACANPTGTNGDQHDMTMTSGICPGHPEQCGGKCCGAKCVETMLDKNNCGDCGVVCNSPLVCSGGGCGCPTGGGGVVQCGGGQSCCGVSGCKSLATDVNNCGMCGHACGGTGDRCVGNSCMCGTNPACTGGTSCCNGSCSASCVPPDMAMPLPDGGVGGLCQCSSHCPLSMLCVGPNCCFEDVFLMTCMPAPPTVCMPNQMP
jgi:hypothetical protein